MDQKEHTNTLVIGGGQAGLLAGYELARRGIPFLIVDANERTGDSWRNRWDSLTLFTPNWANSLAGLPFPGEKWVCPSKNEMADYLEEYASRHELPIRRGVRIEKLVRGDHGFIATADGATFEADNVVIAMANLQESRVPEFADRLSSDIVQLHSRDYRNPAQMREGPVLIVGVGNSGAEIAMDLVANHEVLLSGKESGAMPFRPDRLSGRIMMPFVGKVVLNRLLSRSTPIGRKARRKMRNEALPLGRTKPRDLAHAGVIRQPRTVGVEGGSPVTADGRRLDVANVVWCTGYKRGFDWIELPVFDEEEHVKQERGTVTSEPGLYFVAQRFQHSPLSDTLLGISREVPWAIEHLASRQALQQEAARA